MDGHDNLFQSYGRQASVLADQVFLFLPANYFIIKNIKLV